MNTQTIHIKNKRSISVVEIGKDKEKKWIEFISEHPDASIYHHPLWLKAIERETGQKVLKLACIDENDNILGIFPLQYTKGFPLGIGGVPAAKRLSSLPRTPIGGPLAFDTETSKLLIRKAVDIVKNSNYTLQIKSFDENLNQNLPELKKYFWREIYIKEIPEYPAEVRFGKSKNHVKIKWAVNKAEQNNVKHRFAETESDLKTWYRLYLETMKFHSTPARSYAFFKHLWELLLPSGLMKLIVAEIEEGTNKTIIAGSILFFYNKTVTHAFSGSDRTRKYIELRPNDLLHWYSILYSQENGFKYYDFGEVSKNNTGLAAYKKKWDTFKRNMYHYYYPDPHIPEDDLDTATEDGFKEKLFHKLPAPVLAKLSEYVYKML